MEVPTVQVALAIPISVCERVVSQLVLSGYQPVSSGAPTPKPL
jgi:hypothetical protein